MNSTINNSVVFFDENTILYPAGHQLILYNIDRKSQRVIPLALDGDHISCITVSHADNSIAIGTRSPNAVSKFTEPEKRAAVHVYDLLTFKKRKVYRPNENNATKEFISIAYAVDNKFLFAQGVDPEW
jgi:hypothetical protein